MDQDTKKPAVRESTLPQVMGCWIEFLGDSPYAGLLGDLLAELDPDAIEMMLCGRNPQSRNRNHWPSLLKGDNGCRSHYRDLEKNCDFDNRVAGTATDLTITL